MDKSDKRFQKIDYKKIGRNVRDSLLYLTSGAGMFSGVYYQYLESQGDGLNAPEILLGGLAFGLSYAIGHSVYNMRKNRRDEDTEEQDETWSKKFENMRKERGNYQGEIEKYRQGHRERKKEIEEKRRQLRKRKIYSNPKNSLENLITKQPSKNYSL